jgi:hypothetical protein
MKNPCDSSENLAPFYEAAHNNIISGESKRVIAQALAAAYLETKGLPPLHERRYRMFPWTANGSPPRN